MAYLVVFLILALVAEYLTIRKLMRRNKVARIQNSALVSQNEKLRARVEAQGDDLIRHKHLLEDQTHSNKTLHEGMLRERKRNECLTDKLAEVDGVAHWCTQEASTYEIDSRACASLRSAAARVQDLKP